MICDMACDGKMGVHPTSLGPLFCLPCACAAARARSVGQRFIVTDQQLHFMRKELDISYPAQGDRQGHVGLSAAQLSYAYTFDMNGSLLTERNLSAELETIVSVNTVSPCLCRPCCLTATTIKSSVDVTGYPEGMPEAKTKFIHIWGLRDGAKAASIINRAKAEKKQAPGSQLMVREGED